ncbi:MAG TPA: nucleotidyltransferase family protein [Pirellulales bacterium]|jgi:NDP-sugar pyrophosphorylase family protein|nr:nucleotidyltransferase family protein [Pirellulales bacterium]
MVLPADRGLEQVTVAILAGGLGTRLRSVVSDRPKPLAKVAGRPFLAYQLDQLSAAGFRRVVFCTGYLGQQVQEAFGTMYERIELAYSMEPAPLGTAGAIRFALPLLASPQVLVMNGDSYCDADLADFWRFHRQRQAAASILLTHVDDTARYGQVLIGSDERVSAFREKSAVAGAGWINAGIYLVERRLLDAVPAGRAVSLEREIFPDWVGGAFYAQCCRAALLDIGTPESYAQAAGFLQRKRSA